MTVDTALSPTVLRSTAPATGLFGGGKPGLQAASPPIVAVNIVAANTVAANTVAPVNGEPASMQRKSFSDLFRAELHAA